MDTHRWQRFAITSERSIVRRLSQTQRFTAAARYLGLPLIVDMADEMAVDGGDDTVIKLLLLLSPSRVAKLK